MKADHLTERLLSDIGDSKTPHVTPSPEYDVGLGTPKSPRGRGAGSIWPRRGFIAWLCVVGLVFLLGCCRRASQESYGPGFVRSIHAYWQEGYLHTDVIFETDSGQVEHLAFFSEGPNPDVVPIWQGMHCSISGDGRRVTHIPPDAGK